MDDYADIAISTPGGSKHTTDSGSIDIVVPPLVLKYGLLEDVIELAVDVNGEQFVRRKISRVNGER